MTFGDSIRRAPEGGASDSARVSAAHAQDALAPLPLLLERLRNKPAPEWMAIGRSLVLSGRLDTAASILQAGLQAHPSDGELCLATAGALWQCGDPASASQLLGALLEREPLNLAAAITLARIQVEAGRVAAATSVLLGVFSIQTAPPQLVLRAARMLADAGGKQQASELCEASIGAGSDSSRVRVYAAALEGQLGDFERSRCNYLAALDRDPLAVDMGAAYGLASVTRYHDPSDPELARFRALLMDDRLTPRARASVLFALGKACDDLGFYAQAATHLRAGNGLIDHRGWSRKSWRRLVDAKLARPPLPHRPMTRGEFVPIFVVGAPRSGTTLVAELLGRSAEVCNRGELDWIPHYADATAHITMPTSAMLDEMAAEYSGRLRQGDTGTRWFVDKQPLNFLHTDLIFALFPQARIVYCRRSHRDIALSIWSQHFESEEYRFAYDFSDIAAVLNGCTRLMVKAQSDRRVVQVQYEQLVRAPQATVDALSTAIGLTRFDCSHHGTTTSVIGTASVWQARQPVYRTSVARWRHYFPYVPELAQFPDDGTA